MFLFAACALLLSAADAFNLDVKHASLFSDPEGQSWSYFGYSVALLKETGSDGGLWVLVGAPKGNSTYPKQDIINQPGVVYQCKLDVNNETCKSLVLDSKGEQRVGKSDFSFSDNKEHGLVGSTLEVQGAENGRILVCGPGWKNKYYDEYNLNGVCYILDGSKEFDSDAKKLTPLLRKKYQTIDQTDDYGNTTSFLYYIYGGAGISANFVENSTEMIVGAPGVFQWTGTAIRYTESFDYRTHQPNLYGDLIIPNPERTENFNHDSYFGYSVGSGRFLHSNKTLYVSGAPRAGHLKGKVYIFDFPKKQDESFIIKKEISGYQMGEYFGSCVCVVDLNSDGLDDLVIGAPQHSIRSSSAFQNNGDEGKIYVLINKDNMNMDETQIMGSQQQGARFGTAISNIGDLNNDGYPDIAVGAPYENFGHGAVYIYHGQFDGINPKFVQCIIAQDINPSISGFGFSISRGLDIDGNNYHDLAVGAYESGHAVILKSHPVITFNASLMTNVSRIKFNSTGFLSTVCISYTGKYAPESIDALITVEVDRTYRRARFFTGVGSIAIQQEVKLDNNVNNCSEYVVEILEEYNDFSKPIELIMRYELHETQGNKRWKTQINEDFCISCPVVNPSAPSFIKHIVPYVTGCRDDVCETDIKTELELIDVKLPLVIGSKNTIKMKVTIKNAGEPGFLSQTNITIPEYIILNRIPMNCKESSFFIVSHDDRYLNCEMGNPLKTNETRELTLDFDIRNIPSGHNNLYFKISSNSTGKDLKEEDNIQEIIVPLITSSDISILGKSTKERFYLVKKNDSYTDEVISVSHIYEVRNFGPSPVNRVKLTFDIPVMIEDSSGSVHFVKVYQPEAIYESQSFFCTPSGFEFYSDSDINHVSNTSSGSKEPKRRKLDEESGDNHRRNNPSTSYLQDSRTFYASCSVPGIQCMTVNCIVGPFKTAQTSAIVTFPLKISPELWKPLIESKDVILVSTFGSLEILYSPQPMLPENSKQEFAVNTYIEKLPDSKIAAWIVALAIIGGILLLLLLTVILIKMGFFKRHKKEELESLKKSHEMEQDESLTEDIGDE